MGSSGSGKSTLVKFMLGFYEPVRGWVGENIAYGAGGVVGAKPVLVMDEATSALDSDSESRVQEAWRGRTVIVIAHRLSTLRRMDRIVVMDAGQVVEEGSHEELVVAGGVYGRLWAKQSGGFLPDD